MNFEKKMSMSIIIVLAYISSDVREKEGKEKFKEFYYAQN